MAVAADTVIKPGGASKKLYGTFDRPLMNPNDYRARPQPDPREPGGVYADRRVHRGYRDADEQHRPDRQDGPHDGGYRPTAAVETTTYANLPGQRPYGLVYQLNGEIWYVDRTSGKLFWAKPNGQASVEIASGF